MSVDPRPPAQGRFPAKTLLFVGGLVVAGFLLWGTLWSLIELQVYDHLVDKIRSDIGIDLWLAKALAGLAVVPVVLGIRYSLSFRQRRQRIGSGILIGCWVVYCLVAFAYTREAYFSPLTAESVPIKWYAYPTPEGIRFFDHSGVDPKYGVILRPVTPHVLAAYAWIQGKRTDPATNRPYMFLWKNQGQLYLFPQPFDPATGEILVLPTPSEARLAFEQQSKRDSKRQADERLQNGLRLLAEGKLLQASAELNVAKALAPAAEDVDTAIAEVDKAKAQRIADGLAGAGAALAFGGFGAADEGLAAVLALDPNHVDALRLRSEVARRREQAEEQHRQSAAREMDEARARQLLGTVRTEIAGGRYQEALSAYESLRQARRGEPVPVAVQSEIVKALEHASSVDSLGGRLDRAVEALRVALAIEPNSPRIPQLHEDATVAVRIANAKGLQSQGRHDAALPMLEEVLRLRANHSEASNLIETSKAAVRKLANPFRNFTLRDYRAAGQSIGGRIGPVNLRYQPVTAGVLLAGWVSQPRSLSIGRPTSVDVDLRPGDVVMKVNGSDMKTAAALLQTCDAMEPNFPLKVTVLRSGILQDIVIR